MPLTASSHVLDALAETERKLALRRQQSMEAARMGVGALEQMQALGRQETLDDEKRAQTAKTNERADNDYKLRLSREQRDAANDSIRLQREGEDRTAAREDKAANTLRLTEQHTSKMTDAQRERARQVMRDAVAAGIAQQQDPDTISTALQNRDDVQPFAPGMMSLTDVDAEYIAQKQARMDADNKADLDERAMALRERPKPTGGPRAPKPAAAPKLSAVGEKAKASRESAAKLLDQVESGGKAFEDNTLLPTGGRYMGPVRDALTGYVPGFNEGDRTAARGAEEAYNAMLFPVLGRPDAPADQETKRLAPLMFKSTDTPEERANKIKLGRTMLSEGAEPAAVEADPDIDAFNAAFGVK